MSDARRGQSEVIGIVLLVGVVTVLVVGVGAVLISDLLQNDEQTVASIESDVTAQNITLEVTGGDTIDASTVDVIVRSGDDEYRLGLAANFSLRRGGSNQTLEPGDRWQGATPITSGELRLLVVDTDTGALLHKAVYEVGQTGIVLEIAGDQTATTISEGETVDYTVTQTFESGESTDITDDVSVTSADSSVVSVDDGQSDEFVYAPAGVTVAGTPSQGSAVPA